MLIIALLSALVIGAAGVDAVTGDPLCHDKGGVATMDGPTTIHGARFPVCVDDEK